MPRRLPAISRPVRLAVLISGSGRTLTNFQQQIEAGRLRAEIVLVVADNPTCSGLAKAQASGLKTVAFERSDRKDVAAFSARIFDLCRDAGADLVTLAGFLSRLEIPDDFEQRVLNIHPALIPAFCGQGMYGQHVHRAVFERGCRVSGCTVHFADNEYDNGPILLQQCVDVGDAASPDEIAERVFAAECRAYPQAIEWFAAGRIEIIGRRVLIHPAT